MIINTFFVCPNCGNNKEFRIFTSSLRDIRQSLEPGMRVEESDASPNLRTVYAYVECRICLHRFGYGYDSVADFEKKYQNNKQA